VVRRIGRFEIESEIGRGSMGVVYLATDPRVRRQVALKTYNLPDGLDPAQQEEYRARFLREAQAAGALSHPGIVTVYDVDEDPDSGLPFIAMEYVPGQSLSAILREEGRLELEPAVALGDQLASALGVAHAAGVVHRDIKPANILVRETDRAAKVADFGVARLATSTLTRTGETIGSPAYMSPEQVTSAPMDGRSDLFSLAVILYEALTGARPFAGDDLAAVVYAVVHETHRPPSRLVPELPPGLDAFFDRALAKDPDGRFDDGEAFRRGLQEALSCSVPVADATVTALDTPAEAIIGELTLIDEDAPPRPGAVRATWLRLPRGVRVAAVAVGILLAAWALMSGGGAAADTPAYLQLEGKSKLAEGRLTVEIDGDTVFTRHLALPRRGPRFLGNSRPRIGNESFDAQIAVDPGRHKVVARVEPVDGSDFTGRTSVKVGSGELLTLKLEIGKSSDRNVTLRAD